MNAQTTETNAARLAVLVRELLARETFDTLADLTDALKHRCVRLRLPCGPDDVTAAYRLVGSNRALVQDAPKFEIESRHDDVRPLTRDEARAILHRLRVTPR